MKEIEIAFKEARAFIKNGAKSTNKRYNEDGLPQKRTEAETRRDAHFLPFHLQKEDDLHKTGNTFGNCVKNTGGLATYLLSQREHFQNVALTAVAVLDKGDHVFLLVGAKDGMNKEITAVNDLNGVARDARLYVVDVWANTFCHASDYTRLLESKMTQWARQGKEVHSYDDVEKKHPLECVNSYACIMGMMECDDTCARVVSLMHTCIKPRGFDDADG